MTSEINSGKIEKDPSLTTPENVTRGWKAIFWIKTIIAVIIVDSILFEIAGNILYREVEALSNGAPPSFQLLLYGCASIVIVLISCIPFCIAFLKFCRWLSYAERAQRRFTKTNFSPLGVVFFNFIPIIGLLINYFIFKDLLQRQTTTFIHRKLEARPIPYSALRAILIISILEIINLFVSNFFTIRFLNILLIIILASGYIRIMSDIIMNEQRLHSLLIEDLLNSKVDEIMTEKFSSKKT